MVSNAFPDVPDASNVVDLDFASAKFRKNAHKLVAEWAKNSPFYVVKDGPLRSSLAATPR